MNSHSLRTARSILSSSLLAMLAAGCGGDPAVTPPPTGDPTTMFWQLTLDTRAATVSTVAPYDTIRITATPRTISGSPITDLAPPTYTSMDLDHAFVDPDGLVHAVAVGDQILIVASLEEGNILHQDTLVLNITDASPPPTLATFTIHPDAGDSAKTAESANSNLNPRAFDEAGDPISDVSVYFVSSDPTIATVDRASGFLAPERPGHLSIYATTTVYGVTKTDTLPYTIGVPLILVMRIAPLRQSDGHTIGGFIPAQVTLGVGAKIFFQNDGAPNTDITFDDPTNVGEDDEDCPSFESFCGTGDIPAFGLEPGDDTGLTALRARKFHVAGSYPFHSTLWGTSGTITILDEHTP
jgi:hypothetical protein